MSALAAGRSALATGRSVVARAQGADVPFLAAAIAYYALVSVVPAVLLAVVVAATVGGAELAGQVEGATADLLTPAGQQALTEALESATGRAGASVLGVLLLAWSTLKVFRGFDIAFSRVYGTPDRATWLHQFRDAATVLVAVGAALWGMLLLGGLLAALPLPAGAWAVGLAALLLGLFGAFLPFYYVFPDVPTTIRDAAPGAALAAVGWLVLQAGFQVYAVAAPSFQLYGVLGGVLLLVTWFYLAASLLLLGAVVNVELAADEADEAAGDADDRGPDDRQAQGSPGREAGPSMDSPHDETSLEEEEVTALREAVEALEHRLEEHTVPRAEVESDLRRYVRSRMRRGHARGWGPYLVLLYGTAMTVGAFYLLSGGWAVLAMVVVWLSTLGLYVMMVLAGAAIGAAEVPGRALDAVRDWRS